VNHCVGDADYIALRSGWECFVVVNGAIGFECSFDGKLNARLVKGNDTPISFANGEFLVFKRIELSQPKLAVELFVQHIERFQLAAASRGSFWRETARAQFAGTKNPASTHEGVKAGFKLRPKKLVFSLIRSMARPLPASRNAGLDERKQAGLLAPRSSYSASLTIQRQWLCGVS